MPVTVWKGHLTFGLVSIPVRLFRAARRETVNLHQLYRKASSAMPSSAPMPYLVEPEESVSEPAPVSRIRQAAFTQEEQAPIPPSQVLKGYEFEPDRYVVIEKEDLEKIAPKTATEMQILEFVKISEIDPVFFETSYYVAPEEAGEKAYALLFDALRQSGYVALAEFAMRRRQHAVIIRPGATGIIAHTMFYTEEIRKTDEFRADLSAVTKKERDLAVALVGAMAAPFEPEKFKDMYREKLEQLIAAKIQGREVVAEAPARTAPAVDIMEALQKSLAMKRKPVASAPGPAREAKKRGRR